MKDRDFNPEIASLKAANNIFAMLEAPFSAASVMAALRLAYTTGARDQAMRSLEAQIRHDDRINEAMG